MAISLVDNGYKSTPPCDILMVNSVKKEETSVKKEYTQVQPWQKLETSNLLLDIILKS